MQITRVAGMLLAGIAVVLIGGIPAVASEQAPAASPAGGSWGPARTVAGLAAGATGGIGTISCPAAGDCSAGGDETIKNRQQAFVVSEADGTWGKAATVPGLAALNTAGDAEITSISCAAPGDCSAGGFYATGTFSDGAEQTQAFVVTQSRGSWGKAIPVPGLVALNLGDVAEVFSLSCWSAGDCAAGGEYVDSEDYGLAFVVDESHGTWGSAQRVANTAVPSDYANAAVLSVSCGPGGDCGAGGDSNGQAFVVTESDGSWDSAEIVPGSKTLNTGVSADVTTISCPGSGDCSAGGFYDPGQFGSETVDYQAFVVTEQDGVWGSLVKIPGLAKLNAADDADLNSVSCASPGDCSAGGYYSPSMVRDGSTHLQAFVVSERGGTWGTAIEVPGTSSLNARQDATVSSVSCPSAGNCSAGGFYTDKLFHQQGFVVSETNGSWGKAIAVAGLAALNKGGYVELNALSCATPTSCAAGGYYTNSDISIEPFLVTRAVATSVRLTLSEAKVTYGREQSERVSVTVTSSGGRPAGSVTVTAGKHKVCTARLASGKASCKLTARQLPAGSYQVTARYGGSGLFGGSASAARKLTVAR